MKPQHIPLFAAALVIAIVGALAVGVPLSTVAFGLLVLTCPLMMLLMHGGHDGHASGDGGLGAAAKDREGAHLAGRR
ncbi:DUF2933 domain-containing protein [Actinoplanes sp. NPDC049802]|uniref:DUF2933 domain-containing protein n=1 Tax=Actinoplanes sp. NPDC049802 TaxID=3154742 RepID=UPI0033D2B21B